MSETFFEEVIIKHSEPGKPTGPVTHPGGPPSSATYTRVTLSAGNAAIVAGGEGANGKFSAHGKDGQPLVELNAGDTEAVIAAGQKGGRAGRLTLYDGNQNATINISSVNATVVAGGNGANGRFSTHGRDGQPLVELIAGDNEAVLGLGQAGRPGRISVYDDNRNEAIKIDAKTGDILLQNADCAEEFEIGGTADVDPGTVMVIEEDGRLRPSDTAYDRRVAGVISGAGDRRPAITLGRIRSAASRVPVALVGRVFCKADASEASIEVGDLLTTASRTGHAMKATDPERAFGAVLGKALAPLQSATGLIPILVTLQ